MAVTVRTIRDLNNTRGFEKNRVLVCPKGHGNHCADLARYQAPADRQVFLCRSCDSELWLRFEQHHPADPIAQLSPVAS